MIEVFSPLGIWHVFLYSINTNIHHFRFIMYYIPAIRVNTIKSTYTFTSVDTSNVSICKEIEKKKLGMIILCFIFGHLSSVNKAFDLRNLCYSKISA